MKSQIVPGFRVADYDNDVAAELVRMWRASFEYGVGVKTRTRWKSR